MALRSERSLKPIEMTPIGFVRSSRSTVTDDNWDAEKVSIELDERKFSPEALAGLGDFSHAEIFFYMGATCKTLKSRDFNLV